MPSIYKYYNSINSTYTFSIINKPISSKITKFELGDSSNTISTTSNSNELNISSSIILQEGKSFQVNGTPNPSFIVSQNKVAINGGINSQYTFDVTGNANISTDLYIGRDLTVVDDLSINNGQLNIGNSNFTVTASNGNTSIKGDLKINTDKFIVTASNGNTSIKGDLKINTDKFIVTASNGNTSIAGDLSVTGAFLGRVPLGGVIPVLPVFSLANNSGTQIHTGIPTTGSLTTDGFQLCDGSLVSSSANSIFTTRFVPNLTDDRFIRGSTLANIGLTGGGTVTLSQSNLPSHSHTLNSSTISSHNLSHSHNYLSSGGNIIIRKQGGGSVNWTNGFGSDSDELFNTTQSALSSITPTLNSLTLNNTGSGTPFDVIPKYINAVYLIRVK